LQDFKHLMRGDKVQDFVKGQMVMSKAGHDKDNIYVISSIEDEYLYLVDGRLRKLTNPKKKKKMHVQPINYVDTKLKSKFDANENVINEEIKYAIKQYTMSRDL